MGNFEFLTRQDYFGSIYNVFCTTIYWAILIVLLIDGLIKEHRRNDYCLPCLFLLLSMADQLSGIAIIICIAFGVLTFLLLFIFANRQIKRFSLKSRSGPHVPIAHDTVKALQIEIDRRLDVLKNISYEPKLLKKDEESLFHDAENEISNITPVHLYRMKVLDTLAVLETSIVSADPSKTRLFGQDLRIYLVRLVQNGILVGIELTTIHQFADLYQLARHGPGDFSYEQYVKFMDLLNQMQQSISSRLRSSHHNNNKHYDIFSSEAAEMGKHLSNGKVAPLPRMPQLVAETKEKQGESVTHESSQHEEKK